MEAIGEGASGYADRAAMPGPRSARLWSVPDSRAFALGAAGAGGLRIVPEAAGHDGHDGGATAGLGAAGFGAAGLGAAAPDVFTLGAMDSLKRCLGLLAAAVEAAPGELALAGFPAAADFAGLAEEISRRGEHLQLLSAAAVDRTRTEAINAAGPASKAAAWTTGWGKDSDNGTESAAITSAPAAAAPASTAAEPASGSAAAVSPADDGSRNTAEFLR